MVYFPNTGTLPVFLIRSDDDPSTFEPESERFLITAAGNVGILTSFATERLQIGNVNPATFHDGGQKVLSWNAFFGNDAWRFITPNFHATQILHSPTTGHLFIRTSQNTGQTASEVRWVTGLAISPSEVCIGTGC